MKSRSYLKLVAACAAVAWTCVWATAGPLVREGAAMSDAAAVYAEKCASCHGADGRADTPRGRRKGATDLTKSRIATAAGVKVIANGRELMPGFKDQLSVAEIAAVMDFAKGFRGR